MLDNFIKRLRDIAQNATDVKAAMEETAKSGVDSKNFDNAFQKNLKAVALSRKLDEGADTSVRGTKFLDTDLLNRTAEGANKDYDEFRKKLESAWNSDLRWVPNYPSEYGSGFNDYNEFGAMGNELDKMLKEYAAGKDSNTRKKTIEKYGISKKLGRNPLMRDILNEMYLQETDGSWAEVTPSQVADDYRKIYAEMVKSHFRKA